MKKILTAVTVGGVFLALAVPAHAQGRGGHVSKVDIELHGVFGYGWRAADQGENFGLGVRVGIPLIPNGPIRSINNSLVLGLGADVVFWSGYNGRAFFDTSTVIIPAVIQWNFYIAPIFSIFPEVGVAFATGGCYGCGFGAWPGIALGGRIHFNNDAGYPAFTFRLGFPTGLTLGVSF